MKLIRFVGAMLIFLSMNSYAQENNVREKVSLKVKNDIQLKYAIGESSAKLAQPTHRGLITTAVDFVANVASRALFSAFETTRQAHIAEWSSPIVKDFFYDAPSLLGPLDPSGMKFSGILVSKSMLDSDSSHSVFHLECSVPTDIQSVTDFITNGRFTMELDSLAIDLSKVKAKYTRKKNVSIQIDISMAATWTDEQMNIHKNQELGLFRIALPNLRYDMDNPVVTIGGESAKRMMNGSCFFIPRSHSAFVNNGKYQDCWSAGEFEIKMTVKESAIRKRAAKESYAYEYLKKLLPGSLTQITTNENIVGSEVVKIIKRY